MSQPSSNQNKYDTLLNQFLSSATSTEVNENEQMEQWLEAATNSLRSQFQNHRGNDQPVKDAENENEPRLDCTDELEAAMCVSLPTDSSDEESHEEQKKSIKRSRDSYLSELEMPLTKRSNTDQSFINDVLNLDMISISPGLMNHDVQTQSFDVVASFRSTPAHELSVCNSKSNLEQTIATATVSKSTSTSISVVAKQFIESPKYSDINTEQKLFVPQSILKINDTQSTCIWPVGISHQPDFIEIVVTDEEMNAYWNTIKDFF